MKSQCLYYIILKWYLIYSSVLSAMILFGTAVFGIKEVIVRKEWWDLIPLFILLSAAITMTWGACIFLHYWCGINMPRWILLQY